MGVPPGNTLGGLIEDHIYVFRAFAQKSFRKREKGVRYFAYLLRAEDVPNGLSVGLSPRGAVKYLQSNEGYCRILVRDVHGLPYGLEVRRDIEDESHAYICNLPLKTLSDESLERALLVAGELARLSEVVTYDQHVPLDDEE